MTVLGTVRHRSLSSNKTFQTTNRSDQIRAQYHCPSSIFFTPRRLTSIIHIENYPITMSKALIDELDLKMQQMKEYAQITRGYQNENFQYPIHVRRSHDGEKLPRTLPERTSRHHRFVKTPILTSSTHENQLSSSTSTSNRSKNSSRRTATATNDAQRTFVVPPNKTISDIDPSLPREQSFTTGPALTKLFLHRQSSSSSLTSSPRLPSSRPHSIACLTTSEFIPAESTDTLSTRTGDSTDSRQVHQHEQQTINSLSNSSQSLINQSTSRTPIRTMTQKFFSKLFHNPSKS